MVHLPLLRPDSGATRLEPWARDLARRRVDDPVVAAAECRANATGTFWFSSLRGFGERQILESRGVYLGARLVIGVTALEVVVLELAFGGHLVREVARLATSEVAVRPVPAKTDRASDEAWPAALLVDRFRRQLLEVRVSQEDPGSWDLLAALFALKSVGCG